jgi:Holliday junction resolvase RusA-like endonuclease
MEELTFWVDGVPTPQGSKTRTPYGFREANPRLPAWRRAVLAAARDALGGRDGFAPHVPVVLSAQFFFVRGRTVKRIWMTTKPDLSKLVRAIEDSMTAATVWADDSQVVRYSRLEKRYADDDRPGVLVNVRRLDGAM